MKWHLNGFRGPDAPVLKEDDHNPGEFGFDQWLSVTNFFDRDPRLSRKRKFEAFKGDSSEINVVEALKFLERQLIGNRILSDWVGRGLPNSVPR